MERPPLPEATHLRPLTDLPYSREFSLQSPELILAMQEEAGKQAWIVEYGTLAVDVGGTYRVMRYVNHEQPDCRYYSVKHVQSKGKPIKEPAKEISEAQFNQLWEYVEEENRSKARRQYYVTRDGLPLTLVVFANGKAKVKIGFQTSVEAKRFNLTTVDWLKEEVANQEKLPHESTTA